MARRIPARRLRGGLALLLVATAFALSVRPAGAEWGADLERGADAELVEWIAPDLAAIVAAGPERRPGLVAAFVAGDAVPAIEAVKRFRNPELRPLFRALLDHADWRVAHRALLAIERLEDGAALPRAWDLLGHAEPRLREKAAISCVRLWGASDAHRPARARQDVLARLDRETDPLVRTCLEALARRIEGSLRVERVADEVRVTREDGLVLTPYLRRMSTAREVVPGFEANPVARIRGGSVDELPLATRWTAPLRDFGEEKAPAGRVLQPFGYRRNRGRTVHTGADVGALMEGA
ncbi:MAG TPA: HEAT repeat domain-containing protein, partial [Planctomycetota bacterium]|nr:HEAT repeat domain-containing protein [Planctomycetota bacterium]